LQVLQHVTATAESGNHRIVFEFATLPAPSGVGATYTVAAATPPFSAGPSGQPLAVGGQSFVKVGFHNAYLQDPVNVPPRAAYTGPQDLKPGLPLLSEAVVSDAFEGSLTWVLGLQQKGCWHVAQLTGPVRLVVELRPMTLPVTGSQIPTVPLVALGLAALAGGLFLRRRVAVKQGGASGVGDIYHRMRGKSHPPPPWFRYAHRFRMFRT
jgi:LPXTG-motif cell wall-anchored protein